MGLPRVRVGKPQKETEEKIRVTESMRYFINRKAGKKTLNTFGMRLNYSFLIGHFY